MTSWAPVCEVPCRGPSEGLRNVGNRFFWKVNSKGDFLLKYVLTHALNLRGTLSYVIILGTLPRVTLVKRKVSQREHVTTYPKAESQCPAPVSISDLPSPDVEVRGAPWGCLGPQKAKLRGAGARVRLDRVPWAAFRPHACLHKAWPGAAGTAAIRLKTGEHTSLCFPFPQNGSGRWHQLGFAKTSPVFGIFSESAENVAGWRAVGAASPSLERALGSFLTQPPDSHTVSGRSLISVRGWGAGVRGRGGTWVAALCWQGRGRAQGPRVTGVGGQGPWVKGAESGTPAEAPRSAWGGGLSRQRARAEAGATCAGRACVRAPTNHRRHRQGHARQEA